MGRASHQRALEVWSNGEHVATWHLPSRGPMSLVYSPQWLSSPRSRPLSLSLPLGVEGSVLRGEVVENYFRNLLPDNEAIRQRMAQRFRAASADAFDLLEAVGRDCVGAVQLLAPGEVPQGFDRIQAQPLTDAQVADHLRHTVHVATLGAELAQEDVLRISLAGAQEKTALLRHDGHWCRPLGATPTTHIFKLPLGTVGQAVKVDMSLSVENEWLCSRILHAYGLPVAHTEMATFEDQKVLVVERFDRRWMADGAWIARLPQEDFCQANGLPPTLKYEGDGGPGFGTIAQQLSFSVHADQDRRDFLTSQVLYWMLAAIDGHAKNFSIRLLPQGRYQLTPMYDVLSAWPVVGKGADKWPLRKMTMAMAAEGTSRHYHWWQIQRRHFNRMAESHGYVGGAEPVIQHLVASTPGVIETVTAELPPGFPADLAKAVFEGLAKSAEALARMPAN